MIRRLYPGGKGKAFNITYDDGVLQDIPFVALLNKYALKGTFNLNAQLMQERFAWTHENGMIVRRLSLEEARHLYDGHEIASHTLTHPYMHDLSREEIRRQLKENKDLLEQHFGQEIRGFAVPFDYYSSAIADCARESGHEYARMSEFTGNYTPCRDNYFWKTGFYHVMPGMREYVDGFLCCEEELALCQIVGHSYDLDALGLWDTMDGILRDISCYLDVWPCTHLELVRYLNAMDSAVIEENFLRNDSHQPLWFSIHGKTHKLLPGETVNI